MNFFLNKLLYSKPVHNVESNIVASEGKLLIPSEHKQSADDSANVDVENDEKLDSSESYWRLGWSGRGCWNCGYGWGRGYEGMKMMFYLNFCYYYILET